MKNEENMGFDPSEDVTDIIDNTPSESTEVAIVPELKIVVPSIPDVLNINGVEVSDALIKAEIAKLKKLEIKSVHDKKGMKAVTDMKNKIKKLRTSSDTWRTEKMKPVTKFSKDLKARIDGYGVICSEGEAAADEILKPWLEEIERLENEAEVLKDETLKKRLQLLIDNGGKTMDGITYEFPHDPNLFYNSVLMRDYTDEEWENQFASVTASWEVETARLQGIKDAEEAEKAKMLEDNAKVNQYRTKARTLELKSEGYILDGETWKKGELTISNEDMLTVEDEAFEALIGQQWEVNPVEEEVIPEPAIKPSASFGGVRVSKVSTTAPPADLLSGFDGDDDDDFFPELSEEVDLSPVTEESFDGPEAVEETVITRSLVFSKATPSISFKLSPQFDFILYPDTYVDLVKESHSEGSIAAAGEIKAGLSFLMVKS